MKFLSIIFLLVANLFSSDYEIVTQHFPPYQIYSQDKLTGISVDIVKELKKRTNQDFPITVIAKREDYERAQASKKSIIFSISKTQKRANEFQWVGPVTSLDFVFFKNTKSDITLNSLDDARKARAILVSKHDLAHRVLLRLDFTNLIVLPTNASDENIKTLARLNQNILWAEDYRSGLYRIKQLKLKRDLEPVMVQKPISTVQLNIAFHKEVDNSIPTKWQQTLQEIKQDGTYDKIVQRYISNL